MIDQERPTFTQQVIENTVTNGIGYRDFVRTQSRPRPEDAILMEYNLGSLLQHSIGRAQCIDGVLPNRIARCSDLDRSLEECGLEGSLERANRQLRIELDVLDDFHISGKQSLDGLSYPESVEKITELMVKGRGFRESLMSDEEFFDCVD